MDFYFLKKKTKKKVAPDAAKSAPIKASRISPERRTNHDPRIRQKNALKIAYTTRWESFIGFCPGGCCLSRVKEAGTLPAATYVANSIVSRTNLLPRGIGSGPR